MPPLYLPDCRGPAGVLAHVLRLAPLEVLEMPHPCRAASATLTGETRPMFGQVFCQKKTATGSS